MVIFVPEKLRDLVNGWILQSNRKNEMGGTFFGTETEFKSFLPGPNFSQTPYKEFSRGNADLYEAEFAKLIGYNPVSGMHTHPSGSVPSEGDRKYIQHTNSPKLEVVIADMGSELRWFCFDKNMRHVVIYFKDIELEKMVLSLSQSFGMMDIGSCMITPKGELLCENERGKQFLKFDTDTYLIWKWLEDHKKDWKKTKTQIQKDTGLSMVRINESLKKLGIKDLR
jgi:proteasome lid subunit RPN8/RPN11